MASYAEVQKFEEMIEAVSKFMGEISEACSEMTAAGNDCVEQCDNDDPSTKANAKLQNCVKKFNESVEMAGRVKAGLQREVERLREILRRAEAFDSD